MSGKPLNKYVVKRAFRDKFTLGHYSVADSYESNDAERVMYLQGEGFLNKERIIDKKEGSKGPVHVGGGYYELPNGEKIKGKDAALEALKQLEQVGVNEYDA
ncbi:hypothetical protein EXW28_18175 [Bacillus mycoides]|uniref:hypothetical protein n=1 Tax=Bacillus mycoides TaxID=1405 RepID=UPI001C036C0F|nr:hypothetical protein [Bacillus mycoides]QWG51668.1 hypothetical protein EXW37_18170 [Bacillus mycoides]QWH35471.1 hypothetical protein EXW28_18175 [Bacillus mycoides]